MLARKQRTLPRRATKAGRYRQFFVRCPRDPVRLRNVMAVRHQARKSLDACSEATKKAMDKFVRERIRVDRMPLAS